MASNPRTIIVIDDDEDIRALLKRILSATGMTVIMYKDGKEFLDNLIRVKARIGLILLDIQMPNVNGLVVLKKIQDLRKYTKFKVCMLSAYNDPAIIAKAAELGADGFLTKPIDKAALLIKIRDLLLVQNIVTNEITFAKVAFPATLLNFPIILNFTIVGVSPERILIESIFNFKENCDINFTSKQLCEVINYEKEFTVKILRTTPIRNKFLILAELLGVTLSQTQNLKSHIAQHLHEEIIFPES